jgi:hypothetical protein
LSLLMTKNVTMRGRSRGIYKNSIICQRLCFSSECLSPSWCVFMNTASNRYPIIELIT